MYSDDKGMSTTDADDEDLPSLRREAHREGRKRSLPRGLKKNNSREELKRGGGDHRTPSKDSKEDNVSIDI